VSDDGAQCPVGWWLFDVSFAMPSGNHEMRSLARKVNACVRVPLQRPAVPVGVSRVEERNPVVSLGPR
jgi:hypothetical protein